jgi:hypothetical protein
VVNNRTTDVLTGPCAVDVIALSCPRCGSRTAVPVTDPLKADVVQLFRDAHAGHQPTITFGRQLHV